MRRRPDRRRLLLLIGIFLLALFPTAAPPAVASPRVSGHIVANEVTFTDPTASGTLTRAGGAAILAVDAGSTGGETLLYTSSPIDAGQLFDRVGVHWVAAPGTEDRFFVELRTSADAASWSDWTLLTADEDMHDADRNEWFAAPQAAVPDARFAEYRVWLTDGAPSNVARVGLTFMDVDDLNAGPAVRLLNDLGGALRDLARSFSEPAVASAAPVGSTRILSRQDWAADESILQWPPRYYRVQKAVIHHTVTGDGGSNVAKEIRAIYYYHTVTRGWGDIGYSYIVDKYGNVWTGRQGGDGTEAGHAYGWNKGSIGIAALGTYSVNVPTPAMVGAIANVIAIKFTQFGVQPFGADPFTHQEVAPGGSWSNVDSNPPNVQAHRDCNYVQSQYGGQTACPGNGLYSQLSTIRTLAQNAVAQGYMELPYLETTLPKAGYPGGAVSVGVTVLNRGRTTIPAGTRVSYRLLLKGEVVVAQGAATALGADVPPGTAGSVNVPLSVPGIGNYLVRWDLQTGGAWWSSLYGTPVREQYFRGADWSADWVSDNVPISWSAGETRLISVTVANDGGRVWNARDQGPVKLGYRWVSNATGNVFPGDVKVPLPFDVQPGMTVTLQIPVTAPTYPTNYTMYLDLYKENEFAFADKGIAPNDTATGVGVDFKAGYALGTLPTFAAGQTAIVPVNITNLGKGTFPVTNSFPVNLGYHWATPAGASVVWDGARTKLPGDLLAGQTVTVNAAVTAPSTGGSFGLRLDLVQEGVAWFSARAVNPSVSPVVVAGPIIAAYGATYQPGSSALAFAGSRTSVPITIANGSNFTWPAGGATPVTVGYHWMTPGGETVIWDGLRTKLPTDVPPGGSVTLQAALAYPASGGSYLLRWDMVQEGVAWFSGKGVAAAEQKVSVNSARDAFYGGSIDVSNTPQSLGRDQVVTVPLRVQNLSNFDFDSSVNLSYHWYDGAGNILVWDGVRTPLAGLRVNEVRAVDLSVATPKTPAAYTLRVDLVREGVTWFSDAGMQMPARSISVIVPLYGAAYVVPETVNVSAGSMASIPVTLTNSGSLMWQGGLFNLAYHLYSSSGALLAWDGARTPLPGMVESGQTISLNAQVLIPASPGNYTIRFDLVHERTTWFSAQGVAPVTATLQAR